MKEIFFSLQAKMWFYKSYCYLHTQLKELSIIRHLSKVRSGIWLF